MARLPLRPLYLLLLSLPLLFLLRHLLRPSPVYLSPETTPRAFRKRIIAIGDLHGDLEHALRVLRLAGLVDHRGKWIGKSAVLVQTGDIVDRGRDTIAIYRLMDTLRSQAEDSGGRVISLLGNHEFMNGLGDWRYVTPEDIASFGGERNRRHAMSSDGWIGQTWLANYSVTARVPYTHLFPGLLPPDSPLPTPLRASFPPQILLRRPSLAPLTPDAPPSDEDDPFSLSAASFVHGGIHPSWAALGADGINDVGRGLLEKILDPRLGAPLGMPRNTTEEERKFYGEDGPLWYRGYALMKDEEELCEMVDRARRELGVRRLIMGHTPFFEGIKSRCRGRAIIIDTGISRAYGGSLSCLEISYALTPQIPAAPADQPGALVPVPEEMRWVEREHVAALYEGRPKEWLVKTERVVELPVWW